jgi:hypothetical protein
MYKIVLYNNGKKIKTFEKFSKYGDSIRKYNQLLEENQIFFPRRTMWNGVPSDYELVLTGPKESKKIEYVRDEFGKLITVVPKGDFIIKQINPYDVEEVITHKNTNKRYHFKEFVKKFLVTSMTVIITTINNKLVLEYFENEHIDLFVVKNNDDSMRLNQLIKDFCNANKKNNFMFFDDPSRDNKFRLYDKIQEQLGLDRHYLIRITTR